MVKQYIKCIDEIKEICIVNYGDSFNNPNELFTFYSLDYILKNNYFIFHKEIDITNLGIKISSLEEAIIFNNLPFFNNIKNLLINYDLIDIEEIHLLFFKGKHIFIYDKTFNNDEVYQKLIQNPIVYGICNISDYFIENNIKYKREINLQIDIVNEICHINIGKILDYYDENTNKNDYQERIIDLVSSVFRKFLIFHIFNLPLSFSDDDVNNLYNKLGNKLGSLISCLPVNDILVSKTLSRDIKYDPFAKDLHFYSSNSRQPWHNDYSHYPASLSPDWLILYCLEPSEYGGITSLITNNKIQKIMKKYEPKLWENIEHNINYLFIQKGNNILHPKLLFNKTNNTSNWNYFQIYKDYNDENSMSLREKYSIFLNKNITEGRISTINKNWKKGDCIIFNDHLVMHERSAFYGSRHLKDMHIMDNEIKLS